LLPWLAGLALATEMVRFERISMDQGLSQSSIQAIAQCPDGFLWFGTQFGLDRFDGYRFETWRHDPSRPDSLSDSAITDLLLSSDGSLWVATGNGLNLFDTRSGRAERFLLPPSLADRAGRDLRVLLEAKDGRLFLEGSDAILVWRPDSRVLVELPFAEPVAEARMSRRSAVMDQDGRFWLLNGAGLWRKRPHEQALHLVVELEETPVYPFYNALSETANGRLAVAFDGELVVLDPETLEQQRRLGLDRLGADYERFNSVSLASDGSLWLALSTRVIQYWPAEDRWVERFSGGRIRADENTRQRVKAIEHGNGDIWFTSQYGVARWFAEGGQMQLFGHDPRDSFSIPPSTLGAGYTAFIDNEGSVWIGSRLGGLARYSPHKHRFAHIADRSGLGEIPFAGLNIVRGIAEQHLDGRDYLWLALDHGGVRRLVRRSDQAYEWAGAFHFLGEEGQRLPTDAVWAIASDPASGMVWVLERDHLLGIDGRKNAVVVELKLADGGDGGWGRSLVMTPDGDRLWLAGSRGLRGFEIGADRRSLTPVDVGEIWPERSLIGLLPLSDGRLLVGAREGVGMFDPATLTASWFVDATTDFAPGSSEVYGLAEHHESGWWIGTRDHGLAHLRMDQDGPILRWYGLADGLVDTTIYAILPQDDGQLWISSNNGLMRWDPRTQAVRHFTSPDGIQALEFNHTVAHLGAQGRFYFGGINGVNAFFPHEIGELVQPPRLHLQAINVRGSPWDWRLGELPALKLAHDQNDLELIFVGLKFSDPGRVRYAYRLEGLDADWIDAGNQRQVRYAGLSPGRYRFYARAGNSDGVWSEQQLLATVHIRPPPWLTGWAYAVYALLAFAVLGLVWGLQVQRRRVLQELVEQRTAELVEQQAVTRRQARELEKALEARTLFFANVSHEFRTPLTLIQASLDRLASDGDDHDAIASGRRYLRHLVRLVDQLLDLSRLRLNADALVDRPWAVAPMVEATVAAFRSLAHQRGLALSSRVEASWTTQCSQRHVEKILLNLMTNAIKFSSRGGEVEVVLDGEDDMLRLAVRDTGPGIPEHEQARVFERFHRLEAAEREGIAGAGIGLALVREATVAMGGRIELESRPGQGSTFSILLPASRSVCPVEELRLVNLESVARDKALLAPAMSAESAATVRAPSSAPRILLVEDNRDLRAYLRRILAGEWRVIEAADGETGLALARQEMPDLILSDIMMPGMDGLALLALLRDDLATSHIPVLLLTARQDQETRLKGLSLSADDFLAKPFDAVELVLRLRRMVDNRERMRRRLQGADDEAAPEVKTASAPDLVAGDVSFLDKIRRLVDRQCSDPDFSVEGLADQVNVERRTLQRKLKAMTGLTPAAFIRHHRLQRALVMLSDTDLSVHEIALDSGFSSPQHFSRLFRKHYGMPPDQWRRQRRTA
ncbi:MAG: helix-turn-helix domain-containing protein, partial [Wenzhouxiangella sp.]